MQDWSGRGLRRWWRGLAVLLVVVGLAHAPALRAADDSAGYIAGDAASDAAVNTASDTAVNTAGDTAGNTAGDAAGDNAGDAAITVAGWNVGLDDAEVATIGAQIADFEGVDLWGLAEVNRPQAARALEAAAEVGETGDFAAVVGESGAAMRLAALYDDTRFDLVAWYEIDAINTTGNARAPLVLHLQDTRSGVDFLFMVNHLYRSRDAERHTQAQLLNAWAAAQTLPVIAVGDYNFDWEVVGGEQRHDRGYDLMTAGERWEWVRPPQLFTTQCSGWPCRYESVLDFVFVAGAAQEWAAESEIAVFPGDFPDDTATSDHRAVLATFQPPGGEARGAATRPAEEALPAGALPPTTGTPLAAPSNATVIRGANLRGGPGTNHAIVGSAAAGQALAVVGRNAAGDWLRLADGAWIAAFLVDGAAGGLPVVDSQPPALVPLVELQATVVPPGPPVAPTQAAPTVAAIVVPTIAPTEVPSPAETPLPPPLVEQRSGGVCDPAYPTLCIPPGSPDLDCGDIDARRFPVVGADPHRFDGDGNGVGCERD